VQNVVQSWLPLSDAKTLLLKIPFWHHQGFINTGAELLGPRVLLQSMAFFLSGFPDDNPVLIPLRPFGPFAPREPTKNNQLAAPALPSQHADIRDNEDPLPKVQYCSSIHYRVGIVNPPQEDLAQCQAVLPWRPPNTCMGLVEMGPLNNVSLTVPSCEQLASFPSAN
jgi:hypothetical protein